jgi:hypothetical protein
MPGLIAPPSVPSVKTIAGGTPSDSLLKEFMELTTTTGIHAVRHNTLHHIRTFNGSKYITSLDLSSAFLQVPLEKYSGQWTAFQFERNVYEFSTVPYGFKNSLEL